MGTKDYFPMEHGGARRDRTADLLHAMQALSQLSYSPTEPRTLRSLYETVKNSDSPNLYITNQPVAAALASINSIAWSSRRIVRSWPASHSVTSMGGDTGPLVTATRIGCPSLPMLMS